MKVVNGRILADRIIAKLKSRRPPKQRMAIIIVGGDRPSLSFIAQKRRVGRRLGIPVDLFRLPKQSTLKSVTEKIIALSGSAEYGGIVVQLPLPTSLPRDTVLQQIPRDKDLDLIGAGRQAFLKRIHRRMIVPPAVGALQAVLSFFHFPVAARRVAVVGRGFLIGEPIARWLRSQGATVRVYSSKSSLRSIRSADLVILGAGRAHLIHPAMLKENAGVIDFGYGRLRGRLAGDFDAPALKKNRALARRIGFYTPTPGGTGPIVVAKLFENFYRLIAERKKRRR